MKSHGFTLVEVIIVMVLFAMLGGIIMQTYTMISQVSFRLYQEKEIAKEALVLSQILDNLAQTTRINYEKYQSSTLIKQGGIVDTLHLIENNGKEYSISSTENCKEKSKKEKANTSPCTLSISTIDKKANQHDTNNLLDGKKFKITQFHFKIIPFIGNIELGKSLANDEIKDIPAGGQAGFWVLGSLYSNYYNPDKRSNNIFLPIQFFFSLQGKSESLYSSKNDNATANP